MKMQALCRENNVKPVAAVQMYLKKGCLRFCVDHINLKDWSLILCAIIQDRSLSKMSVYSRCRHKRIREKIDTEEKFAKLRIGARKDRRKPVLFTNFLLRSFVDSVAVCLKNSLMIKILALDGIPLAPKYLKILCDGLANNRNLQSLSLAKCRIGDAGCNLLLETLQYNSSLHILNLSSCCLTNRSALSLSLFLKKRRAILLQNAWKESTVSRNDICATTEEGLRILILNRNKLGDNGLRQLFHVLKGDFWLKILCLRHCGITKYSGESLLELLRTNSVLTEIDLRENEMSSDVLQTVRKILKKRKNKGERISLKERLPSHKYVHIQSMTSNNSLCQHISKEKNFPKMHAINSKSQLPEMQRNCKLQIRQSIRAQKERNCRKRQSLNAVKRSYIEWNNIDKLKKCLSSMIECNQNLIASLENSTDFFIEERNRRLYAEKAYLKIQPRLRNLKKKIAMYSSIQSNMHYENQIYKNVHDIFRKLGIFAERKESFGQTQ